MPNSEPLQIRLVSENTGLYQLYKRLLEEINIIGWIDNQWLFVIAISLAWSFAIAAALNTFSQQLYTRHLSIWKRLQRDDLTPDDQLLDIKGATVAVIGMGGVGTGAYDKMHELHGESVIGVDIDYITAKNQRFMGRNVLHGDPSDADFWDRMQATHTLKLVMLALPKVATNMAVLKQLKASSFTGHIAATAKFPDEAEALKKAGATTVFNIYTEADAGFDGHVLAQEKKA